MQRSDVATADRLRVAPVRQQMQCQLLPALRAGGLQVQVANQGAPSSDVISAQSTKLRTATDVGDGARDVIARSQLNVDGLIKRHE